MSAPQNATEVEAITGPTLDKFVADCEPALRKVSESIYDQLLDTVQDYLRDNAAYNIGAQIDGCRQTERDNIHLRLRNRELLDLAYQYRNDLRYPPTHDSVARRLAAIDAAIVKATGK